MKSTAEFRRAREEEESVASRRKRFEELPEFTNEFLQHVVAAFKLRGKALSHRGQFMLSGDREDSSEWLDVVFELASRRVIILQMVEGNRASLYVRSNSAADRGKVLFRYEGLALVDNGPRIARTLEETISLVNRPDLNAPEWSRRIQAAWDRVCVRSVS